jgi:hypothetical protein
MARECRGLALECRRVCGQRVYAYAMPMPAMPPMPHLEHVLNLFSLSYSHVLVGEDALADHAQLLRHLRIFLIRPFLPLKHIQGGQTLRGPPSQVALPPKSQPRRVTSACQRRVYLSVGMGRMGMEAELVNKDVCHSKLPTLTRQ